ncbi:MAG TPA: SCO6880 family protein, partial [Acidimicrobiales bacterium]|nr:SCO6880 family protein [Acidimicrobiales bacterium]
EDPHADAAAEVSAELRLLAGRVASADLAVAGPLSPAEVAGVLREAFDPAARDLLGARSVTAPASATPGDNGPAPANATPLARCTGWDHYQTEDAWHATYWVAEWPRLEVGADWLAPLMLVRTAGIRTVSLIMEAVPPALAVRRVERDVLGHEVDAQQRSRWGFATTARHSREHEGALRREQELVSGYVDVRFAGFVAVTGATRHQLDEACRDVEQAAVQSHLDLRRLYGQQAEAFVATLPACAGLARPGVLR